MRIDGATGAAGRDSAGPFAARCLDDDRGSAPHRLTRKRRPSLASSTTVPAPGVSPGRPTCSVLDHVLGPLNVNLLGLIVDLKRVHLVITANPAGGVLGSLFCGLANTQL